MLFIRFLHSRFVDQHYKDEFFYLGGKEKRGIRNSFL